MKRLISLLLCVLMVAGMGVSVFAETIPPVIAEGDCSYTASDHVSWKVTDDGVLTIGQVSGIVHDVLPIHVIMDRMMEECFACLDRYRA